MAQPVELEAKERVSADRVFSLRASKWRAMFFQPAPSRRLRGPLERNAGVSLLIPVLAGSLLAAAPVWRDGSGDIRWGLWMLGAVLGAFVGVIGALAARRSRSSIVWGWLGGYLGLSVLAPMVLAALTFECGWLWTQSILGQCGAGLFVAGSVTLGAHGLGRWMSICRARTVWLTVVLLSGAWAGLRDWEFQQVPILAARIPQAPPDGAAWQEFVGVLYGPLRGDGSTKVAPPLGFDEAERLLRFGERPMRFQPMGPPFLDDRPMRRLMDGCRLLVTRARRDAGRGDSEAALRRILDVVRLGRRLAAAGGSRRIYETGRSLERYAIDSLVVLARYGTADDARLASDGLADIRRIPVSLPPDARQLDILWLQELEELRRRLPFPSWTVSQLVDVWISRWYPWTWEFERDAPRLKQIWLRTAGTGSVPESYTSRCGRMARMEYIAVGLDEQPYARAFKALTPVGGAAGNPEVSPTSPLP